ncbi:MAG: ABC transporter substrate-binding protein, partial [Candidatus Dormibacteraeota bacterium]|nr:ABC transporter substrate-binding protein [Candidatus Dormibacteraeota bacterium]
MAVLALTAACGTGGTNTGPPPHNNTLIYGAPGEPDTLDPAAGLSGFDQYYTKSIYDTLIKTDTHVNPVVPDLATSWEFMGTDKLTFRLHLRHGVLFQDGTPFNADAVKATIDHNRTTGLLTDIVPIKSETVVDDYTVDLNLSRPYSPLPAVLTGASGMMLSPTALQKYGKDFGRHPVGAGPFTFESWTAGSEVVTTRFAGYWNKGAIHFSGITYKVFGDTNAMTSALISGQIDFAQLLNLPAQSIAPLKARSNLVADVKTTLSPGIVT